MIPSRDKLKRTDREAVILILDICRSLRNLCVRLQEITQGDVSGKQVKNLAERINRQHLDVLTEVANHPNLTEAGREHLDVASDYDLAADLALVIRDTGALIQGIIAATPTDSEGNLLLERIENGRAVDVMFTADDAASFQQELSQVISLLAAEPQ